MVVVSIELLGDIGQWYPIIQEIVSSLDVERFLNFGIRSNTEMEED